MAIKGELFNTDMVRAFLEGRKSRTSRPIKCGFEPIYKAACLHGKWNEAYGNNIPNCLTEWYIKNVAKPKYQPGDIMYVRETWQEVFETEYDKDAVGYCVNIRTIIPNFDDISKTCMGLSTCESCSIMKPRNRYYVYKSSNIEYANPEHVLCWRPSIHMPREAARLFFRVTDVKAQKLEDMTERDAEQDGFEANEDFNDFARDQARGLRHDGIPVEVQYSTALSEFKDFWKLQYGPNAKWMWAYSLQPVTKEEALK